MAADADNKLTVHHIVIDSRPSAPAAVSATVAELGARAGTRRYLALVDWRIERLTTPVNCGAYCRYYMSIPMEMALFDRQTGKTVWHALHMSQNLYLGSSYDPKSVHYLSGAVTRPIGPVISTERTRLTLQNAGISLAAALLPGSTLALDPAVNLILINDNRSSPEHEDGHINENTVVFTLKRAGDSKDKQAYFFPHYHGYFAFKLPPGQYTLTVDKKERTIDVVSGGKPLYLAATKPLFGSGSSVDELDANTLLSKFTDAANWALPEITPASWQSKKRVLRWAPQ